MKVTIIRNESATTRSIKDVEVGSADELATALKAEKVSRVAHWDPTVERVYGEWEPLKNLHKVLRGFTFRGEICDNAWLYVF